MSNKRVGVRRIITPSPTYTFKTSKLVGDTIEVGVVTSTGYWKYNHNNSDSIVYLSVNKGGILNVTNSNGEFIIISCLSDGTPSGVITLLNVESGQLTSFNGTGLSGLTELILKSSQLTSFNGTGLSTLTKLNLGSNQLTSFNGTGLSSLTQLFLISNQLTSFNGTGLSGLTQLNLRSNQLTSFNGTGLSSLTNLFLENNQITSFNGNGLSNLGTLFLSNNPITSLDVSTMPNLRYLFVADDYGLGGNLTATANDNVLIQLVANGLEGANAGSFYTSNGRTSASDAAYNTLVSRGWNLVIGS